ncbi:MAG TPA: hypothetical protein DCG49_12485 [Ruminococcus sp.]|nr:hypothetical protein [Ruminococcus sp.]
MSSQEPFAVCFSGHRPVKLPDRYELRLMLSMLYHEIETAIADGANTFYTGMSQGIDLWAADIVLHIKQTHPSIRLIGASPYPEFGKKLRGSASYHYRSIMEAADTVIYVSHHYHAGVFRIRNQYMISRSKRVIAIVSDMRSGTGQTIRMAKRAGLDIRLLKINEADFRDYPAPDIFQF